MNQAEPNDRTWELLKQAKNVEPSPFFVRNVLREVRQLDQAPSGLRARLLSLFGRRVLLVGAAACTALAVVLVPLLDRGVSPEGTIVALTLSENQSETFDPASEMAAIEYLGQLMAVADPGQLDDASLAELFF